MTAVTRFGLLLILMAAAAAAETPEEFIARHPLVPPPVHRPPSVDAESLQRYQNQETFDEAEAAANRYGASVVAMKNLFRQRAAAERTPPRNAEAIRAAIDSTFGVSRFGTGLEMLQTETEQTKSGVLKRVSFRFGDGGFGEAIIGEPAKPNGLLLVALHGCTGSPDIVMLETRAYTNSFGLRALEQGFTVVAPYVMSQCWWVHNLDYVGQMSGVSVFGYEIAKIGALTRWARDRYSINRTGLWGISLGGQYAMFAGALFPDLFDAVVISGAAANYEQSYLDSFDKAPITTTQKLGNNAQVALSASFARPEIALAIFPRQLIFEVSTSDLRAKGAPDFIARAERLAIEQKALQPRVVLFEGGHETNPDATIPVLTHALRSPRTRAIR